MKINEIIDIKGGYTKFRDPFEWNRIKMLMIFYFLLLLSTFYIQLCLSKIDIALKFVNK